jgi:predicted AAA+ superfamily ATPase
MFRQEQIAKVLDAQQVFFLQKETGLVRETLEIVPVIDSYATIITGIRRCGKSTLSLQLLKNKYTNALYLHLEDIRLAGFETSDFIRLHAEIELRGIKVLFFDEIQLISKWEVFIHQLLNEGYIVFITGSNATLLSKELGTHLTGRHISTELFPFSYTEFVAYKNKVFNEESLADYLTTGGFPAYVKSGVDELLINLVDDILYRDIAVRYGIHDVNSLRQLLIYLLSNVGNLLSANKIIGLYGIKSTTTLLEYFSYLKNAYLIEFLPKFDYSLKAQARNPKKIYAMDMGLVSVLSDSFTANEGHRLENLVYLHLRRRFRNIYYFKAKNECDFVAFENGKPKMAIQVCAHIDDLNFDREYNGLIEAMQSLSLMEGVIITLNQTDKFENEGLTVRMIPAYKYLSE